MSSLLRIQSLMMGFSLIIGWIALSPAQADPRFVNSLEDFRRHTQLHIRRVHALGMELVRAFPEEFNGIDTALLSEYLKLHDQAKISEDISYLLSHGLEKPRTLLTEIYRYYGKKIDFKNDHQANALFGELNQVDNNIGMDFFRKHGLIYADGTLSETAIFFKKLERLADTVDRTKDPVAMEEFNRLPNRVSEVVESRRQKIWAKYLEDHYKEITAAFNYTSNKRVKAIHACLLKSLAPGR